VANKITVLVDLVTDKAISSARGFKASIADAEGAANKFKAGASSAFATVQANAGALALGAGTAIAAFGAKSVKAFQDTALAAGKLSDATGLTVEDASRLQEVAGDLGVNTDALAGSLVRMQKAVASNSAEVQQLGIETKRTADGQVDVNGTFLEAIDKLGGVEDANQRALIASKLFGKGFADSAELILGDADEIKQRLDEVADAQVISPEQVARAKKFRDQMDDLSDSLKQVEITVGDQLVPVIGGLAEALVDAEKAAGKLNGALDELPGDISLGGINRGELGALGIFVRAVKEAKDALDGANPAIGQASDASRALVDASIDAAQASHDEAAGLAIVAAQAQEYARQLNAAGLAARDAADDTHDFGDATEVLTGLMKKSGDQVDFVTGKINDLRGVLDLTGQLDDIAQGFDDVQEAAKDATDPEGARKYRDEVRRLQGQLLDLVDQFKDLSQDKRVKIIAEIASGNLDTLRAALDDLTKDRFMNLTIVPKTIPLFQSANVTAAPGAAPSAPIFNGQSATPSQPMTTDARTIINYFPVGTTPTTQYQNDQIDLRRNGPR
jgi:TP901 family phage tail tape measure protein